MKREGRVVREGGEAKELSRRKSRNRVRGGNNHAAKDHEEGDSGRKKKRKRGVNKRSLLIPGGIWSTVSKR